MKVLTLNAGSSSLKYKLFSAEGLHLLAAGRAERIGTGDSLLHNRWHAADGIWRESERRGATPTHASAIEQTFADLAAQGVLRDPANLLGIEVARRLFPRVPHVAVFDTAFHHTLPPHANRYALPEALYQTLGVRRYGFHGTSVQYVCRRMAALTGQPLEQLNLIVLHLGNGASVTAVRAGCSVDNSMGMTPLA